MTKPTLAQARIDRISFENSKQARVMDDDSKVDEYAAALEAGQTLPPVDLYRQVPPERPQDFIYLIGDGWKRIRAHIKVGRILIDARIHEEGRAGAIKHACRANTIKQHGVVRTQADARNAIQIYLLESDWYLDSDPVIAKNCEVDHKTVATVRERLEKENKIPLTPERRGANGVMQASKKNQVGNSQPEQPSLPITTPSHSRALDRDANAEKGASNSALTRLSISSPTESSQRVMGAFDNSEKKQEEAQKTTPAGEVDSVAGDTKPEEEELTKPLVDWWNRAVNRIAATTTEKELEEVRAKLLMSKHPGSSTFMNNIHDLSNHHLAKLRNDPPSAPSETPTQSEDPEVPVEASKNITKGTLHQLLRDQESKQFIKGWSVLIDIPGQKNPKTLSLALSLLPDAQVGMREKYRATETQAAWDFFDDTLGNYLCSLISKAPEVEPLTQLDKKSPAQKQQYKEQQNASREAKHAAAAGEARSLASPDKLGPFSLILADCPWEYDAKISEAKSIERHYPTLSVEELCKLPVQSITAPKAVLYLWATAALIKEALQVIDSWGFVYKSHYVWIKGENGAGLGHWVRGDHELLFIATKGGFAPPLTGDRTSSVLTFKKGRHSEKPKEVRELLESMFPDQPKVELFARETAEGWMSIGNEIDGRDIRDVLSEDKRQLGLPLVATPEAKPALLKEEIPKTLYAALRHLETVTFKGQSIQITCGDRSGMSVDYVIKGYFDDPVTWNAEKRIISTGEEPNYEIIVKEEPQEQRSLFPCPPKPRLHRVLELIEKDFENWHVRLEFKGQPTLSSYSQIKAVVPDRDLKPYQQGSLNANHPTAVYILHDADSSEEVGRVVLWQLKPKEGAKEPRLFRAITQLEACKTKEEFKETYDRLVVLAEGEEVVELVKRHNEMKAKLPSQENVKPEKTKKERGQKEKPSVCAFCEKESPLSSMRYFDERPCCPVCWPAQEPYDYAILAAYSKGAPVVRLNMEFGPEKSEHRVTKYEEACLKKDSRLAVSNQGFATAGPLCGPCGVFLGDKRQPHSLHCNTEEHRANCHERAGQHTRHLAGIGQLGSLADLEMAEGSYLAQAKPDEVLSIQAALAVRRQELTPKEPKLSSLERGLKRLSEATSNTQCLNIFDDLIERAKNKPDDRKKINEARQSWLKTNSTTTAPAPKRNKGKNEELAKKKNQPHPPTKKKARSR